MMCSLTRLTAVHSSLSLCLIEHYVTADLQNIVYRQSYGSGYRISGKGLAYITRDFTILDISYWKSVRCVYFVFLFLCARVDDES